MRLVGGFANTTTIALLLTCTCMSQHASLRREDDVSDAEFIWEFGGAFFPHGSQGVGVDSMGNYYEFTRFTGECQSSVSGTWRMNGAIRLGFALRDSFVEVRELRTYTGGEQEIEDSAVEIGVSSYCELRISPDSPLDPRLRFTHTMREGTEVATLISYLTDPIALACSVGIESAPSSPDSWANVMLSAGFVANPRVSLSVVGQWSIPLEEAGLPTSAVSLHSRCSLDYDSKRTLHFRLVFSTSGQTTWIGFGGSLKGVMP
jgi:hypothetical protein